MNGSLAGMDMRTDVAAAMGQRQCRGRGSPAFRVYLMPAVMTCGKCTSVGIGAQIAHTEHGKARSNPAIISASGCQGTIGATYVSSAFRTPTRLIAEKRR